MLDARANWYIQNGEEIIWATRSIAYTIRDGFMRKYPKVYDYLWSVLNFHRPDKSSSYTHEQLVDMAKQVAIDNMEEIDQTFEELKITDLADKAFVMAQCWSPALYHNDPDLWVLKSYIENKKKVRV